MQVPAQITFHNLDHSDVIEKRIAEEVSKLEQFYDRIISCRVIVERPQKRHQKGDTYAVRIFLEIPGGHDIVVNRDAGLDHTHEDAYVAIRDAFGSARRQLQDLVRIRQGEVKHHEAPPTGRIATLVPAEDHGHISSADGRLIYFHRNSVEGDAFDKLEVGQEVRFAEAVGDKGPQATFVKLLS
ncbi:MAG: 30S ribosomal protein S30 [Alphaproteobacteria bacterium BRH_c36]|nr:MAG: 30S ribosomal protein S30 [Alphaproteobacteria bacterium BRH_c36]